LVSSNQDNRSLPDEAVFKPQQTQTNSQNVDYFEDFIGSKTYSSTSEYNPNKEQAYEHLKQLQRQIVLDKIESDIQDNTNKTIKKSINDIDQIMRNPKQKINSLTTKKVSDNSFVTPFYEEHVINEVKATNEDDRRPHFPGGKSWTTPPFFKQNAKVFNFSGYNQYLPNDLSYDENNLVRVKSSSPTEDPSEITQDFDPASYVNPQFIKGFELII